MINKPYSELLFYVHSLPEYLKTAGFERERLDYALELNEVIYNNASTDIEELYKLFYRFGNTLLNFTGHKTFKELAEELFGAGVCERREETKRLERQKKHEEFEQEQIRKEREFQLSEQLTSGGKTYTVKEFLDNLFANNYKVRKQGNSIGSYYVLTNEEKDSEFKLSKPLFRRKYVMDYIKEKVN